MKHNLMQRNIKKTAGFFLMLLAILILYITYLQIIKGDELYENPLNKRTNAYADTVARGDILDRHDVKLAYSHKTSAGYERIYPLEQAAAHAVGYTDAKLGSSGVENLLQSYLSGSKNPVHGLGAIENILRSQQGATVRLTLDARLQQAAYESLDGRRGAVVALNPKTGEILAMVSTPSYNPNTVAKDWSDLQQNQDSVLLNRAVQGLYPPGSVLKAMIADAALTENITTPSRKIDCPGYLDINAYRLPESHGAVHGNTDLAAGLTVSCNTYFATMALELGAKGMQNSFERFGFSKELTETGFYEEMSHIPIFSELGDGDIAQCGIGQGSILVTPLRMAMQMAVFANHGKLMKPYIVSEIISPGGLTLKKYQAEKWLDVTTAENADIIMHAMKNAVDNGTGSAAYINGVAVAGKTGTAENAQGEPHAWFIGGAPADNPSIVVAVIVENVGGGGRYAAPIARHIIEKMMSEEGNR